MPQAPPVQAKRDALLREIKSELDRHPELEHDTTLRTISLIVVLHERTGRPVRIVLRTEGQRDLNSKNAG